LEKNNGKGLEDFGNRRKQETIAQPCHSEKKNQKTSSQKAGGMNEFGPGSVFEMRNQTQKDKKEDGKDLGDTPGHKENRPQEKNRRLFDDEPHAHSLSEDEIKRE